MGFHMALFWKSLTSVLQVGIAKNFKRLGENLDGWSIRIRKTIQRIFPFVSMFPSKLIKIERTGRHIPMNLGGSLMGVFTTSYLKNLACEPLRLTCLSVRMAKPYALGLKIVGHSFMRSPKKIPSLNPCFILFASTC